MEIEVLKDDVKLSQFGGAISRSGEGDWTIEAAKEQGLKTPAIETAVEYRKKSETDSSVQSSFTAKMINALRRSFGGHPVRSLRVKKLRNRTD